MDLETENRLAALLMEEARRLRAQADKEGIDVYLRQPNVRGRPNSRFLTATVLGVEQANRTVEVSELWRARNKELELDAKLKSRENDKNRCRDDRGHHGNSHHKSSSSQHGQEKASRSSACSWSNRGYDGDSNRGYDGDSNRSYHSSDDGGLMDDEVEEFLRSRAKRGRGAIGSRMDEPGPYPSVTTLDPDADGQHLVNPDIRFKEEWESRILGPEKPPTLVGSINSLEPLHNEVGGGAHCSNKQHHSRGKKKSERTKGTEKKKSKHHHRKSQRRRGSERE